MAAQPPEWSHGTTPFAGAAALAPALVDRRSDRRDNGSRSAEARAEGERTAENPEIISASGECLRGPTALRTVLAVWPITVNYGQPQRRDTRLHFCWLSG